MRMYVFFVMQYESSQKKKKKNLKNSVTNNPRLVAGQECTPAAPIPRQHSHTCVHKTLPTAIFSSIEAQLSKGLHCKILQ